MTNTPGTTKGMPVVPLMMGDEKEHRRQIAQAVNRAISGLINCHQDVTLRASTSTTKIIDNRIGYNTAIIPAMAMTLDAATIDFVAGIWVDTVVSGTPTAPASAIIHHANNAATDRTIRFVLLG